MVVVNCVNTILLAIFAMKDEKKEGKEEKVKKIGLEWDHGMEMQASRRKLARSTRASEL